MPGNQVPLYYVLNGIRFSNVLFSDRKEEIAKAYKEQQLTHLESNTLLTRKERNDLDKLVEEIFLSE